MIKMIRTLEGWGEEGSVRNSVRVETAKCLPVKVWAINTETCKQCRWREGRYRPLGSGPPSGWERRRKKTIMASRTHWSIPCTQSTHTWYFAHTFYTHTAHILTRQIHCTHLMLHHICTHGPRMPTYMLYIYASSINLLHCIAHTIYLHCIMINLSLFCFVTKSIICVLSSENVHVSLISTGSVVASLKVTD